MTGTPLHSPYRFSYMRRGKAAQPKPPEAEPKAPATETTTPAVVHPYETSIKVIAKVATVEDFWQTYDHLIRPNDLPTTTDYHFFRGNITPTWEDKSNERGGKWIVRLPKGMLLLLHASFFVSLKEGGPDSRCKIR